MSPRVVLLHDAYAVNGPPDASDVLNEAMHVARGLATLGYETVIVPVGLNLEDLEARLAELAPHVVFNLMESIAGSGRLIHVVPALLETLGIPYTGCSAFAQWTTSNKIVAKRVLGAGAIATPDLFAATEGHGPWIVKSVWEHASFGLDDASVVDSRDVGAAIGRRARELGGEWFAERYIAGRELNVALLADGPGPQLLPVAEMRFEDYPEGKPRIVGYAAKWRPQSFEYAQTVRSFDVDAALAAAAASLARQCWELFELGGYARVDFRVDAAGRLFVLDINANPCLAPDAGFAAMLETGNVAFPDALARLVGDALARQGGRARHRLSLRR
jgi:D-alanine-D-alanine ligase